MLNIQENVPLAPYTTLGIGGPAAFFVSVASIEELHQAIIWAKERNEPITILGGGSNVLIEDKGIAGLVIHIGIDGIEYEELSDTLVRVRAGAGIMLDELIHDVVLKDIWGLENLSLIPGTVGATPIQNVGAYGVEVKDVIESVEVFDTATHELKRFSNESCEFGYRDSLFKREEGKRFIVTQVTFLLSRVPIPELAYKDLAVRFAGQDPTLPDIRNAIIEIRKGKFPDWKKLGTAGSFFKNPFVTQDAYQLLIEKYPNMPGFPQDNGTVKIPLGWLLEHVLNKKGYRKGNVGLYEKQALVLINFGGATAEEVLSFSEDIIREVKERTNIDIEREVRVLG